MAKTMFKRLAGRINSSRPSNSNAKDYEFYIHDDGSNLSFMVWDDTNSVWVGAPLTTSTSTSTTTSSSTSTTTS